MSEKRGGFRHNGGPYASPESQAVQDQVLQALRDGPLTVAEIFERVEIPEGKGRQFVHNRLTMLKQKGRIAYSLASSQWSLVDGDPAPPAAQRPAAGAITTPSVPRDTGPAAPSRLQGPARRQAPVAAPRGTPPDQEEPNADAQPAAAKPDPAVPPTCDSAPRPGPAEPVFGWDGVVKDLHTEDEARERFLGPEPQESRVVIAVRLELGPAELHELGDDAGEVLRSAAILIRAEETVKRMRKEPQR